MSKINRIGTGVNPSVKTRYTKYHPLNLLAPGVDDTATVGDFKQSSCKFINNSIKNNPNGVALNPLSNRHIIPGSKSWNQVKGMLSCSDVDMPPTLKGQKGRGKKAPPVDGSQKKRGPLPLSRQQRAQSLGRSRRNPQVGVVNLDEVNPFDLDLPEEQREAAFMRFVRPSPVRSRAKTPSVAAANGALDDNGIFFDRELTDAEIEEIISRFTLPSPKLASKSASKKASAQPPPKKKAKTPLVIPDDLYDENEILRLDDERPAEFEDDYNPFQNRYAVSPAQTHSRSASKKKSPIKKPSPKSRTPSKPIMDDNDLFPLESKEYDPFAIGGVYDHDYTY